MLDSYRDDLGIIKFDLAVDFGWFYFLTKPIFYVLHWLAAMIGNFGVAILILTVLIKLIFFPLANKSYRSMAKLRKLQPEMMKLRERFGGDRQRMNQEMMTLYRREGANPVAAVAHRHPDPGLLCALQGALCHHRDAPRALLRLDSGSFRTGSHLHLQPLRPVALQRAGPWDACDFLDRRLADPDGHLHVRSAAA